MSGLSGLRLVAGDQPARGAEPLPARTVDAVDEWGASHRWTGVGRVLARLRWRVEISGADRLPARGGALLVTNPRRGALVPVMTALALGRELGRTVRFAGHDDIAPSSTVLRRMGAVLALPGEVEGALRGRDLVVAGAVPDGRPGPGDLLQFVPLLPRHWRAGTVPVALVAAARAAGVPVHPVAVLSSPVTRSARVEICPAVRPRLDRRGPLAHTELAERVQRRLQQRLDEIGVGDS